MTWCHRTMNNLAFAVCRKNHWSALWLLVYVLLWSFLASSWKTINNLQLKVNYTSYGRQLYFTWMPVQVSNKICILPWSLSIFTGINIFRGICYYHGRLGFDSGHAKKARSGTNHWLPVWDFKRKQSSSSWQHLWTNHTTLRSRSPLPPWLASCLKRGLRH